MAEGISLAKELIEFDPEKEGLPKEGNVYLKIQDRFFELDLKLRMLAPTSCARPGVSKRLPVCRQQDPGR